MSRFETPDMALRRAQILAQRETQKQKQQSSIAAAVRRMRQRMGVRPALSLKGQGIVTERHAGGLSSGERERFTMLTPAEQLREARGRGRQAPPGGIGGEPGGYGEGTLGPPGLMAQLTSPVVPTQSNPLRRIPGIGASAARVTSPLTNPVGVGFGAAFPGATAGGIVGGTAFGTAGGLMESAGVEPLDTPIGRIGPRSVGEFGGGFFGGPGRAPSGVAARQYARRAGETIESAGGVRQMAASEAGGTRIPRLRSAAETDALPTPVNKLATAIRSAGKATPAQRAMFAVQRGERTATAAGELAAGQGDEAFRSAKTALKGEFERPQFAVPEFSDADMFEINEGIRTAANIPFYTKLHAKEALDEVSRGRIPQPAQLKELYRVHPELVEAIQTKRSLGTKAFQEMISFLGLPQKLKSTYDMGTRMRQGLVLGWSHPKQWMSNWKPMTNAMFTEQGALETLRKLEANEWYSIQSGEKAGLGFADQGGHMYHWDPTTPGTERVEGFQGMSDSFINRATDRIPGILGSQRSFATDLNKSGVEVYAKEAQAMWNAGMRDPDQYKALAKVINHARGYGDFNPGQIAQGIHAFFSGRNLVSRFQVLLDPLMQPGSLFKPSARQLAAKNLVGLVAGDMALLGLLGTAGAATGVGSVEMNPLKPGADWLKFRIGNTRLDPWGGFNPLARLIARMGAAAATETGAVDAGWTKEEVKSQLVNFFTNKEAPLVRLLTDVAGITYPFEKRELKPKLLAELYAPFITEDVWDAVKEHGWTGLSSAVPSVVGVGVQTYGEAEPEPETPRAKRRDGRQPQINPAEPRIQPRRKLEGTIGR